MVLLHKKSKSKELKMQILMSEFPKARKNWPVTVSAAVYCDGIEIGTAFLNQVYRRFGLGVYYRPFLYRRVRRQGS